MLNNIISKVYSRLEKVFLLTNEIRGSNNLMKTKRGPTFKGMKFNYDKNMNCINNCDGVYNDDLLRNEVSDLDGGGGGV